jgi:hypothetical protein
VLAAVAVLRQDIANEAGLGDAAKKTQNIAVGNAAQERMADTLAGTDAALINQVASVGHGSGGSPEKVLAAVAVLRQDIANEAGLGDAAKKTQNIAVGNAAQDLRDLVVASPENIRLAVEGGGIAAVIHSLKQRPNSEAVQEKATCALGYLVADCFEYQSLAGEAGGVEMVVSALRGHPNSVVVAESAVEALGKLVADIHLENQMLARLAGGIDAVIVALHQHPENEALQKNATLTLGLLVINNIENQLHAGGARGIQAVISALKTHLRCELVLEHAIDALRHLVACNHENQELVRELGVGCCRCAPPRHCQRGRPWRCREEDTKHCSRQCSSGSP